ncbi:MAG: group 1 truncated hemoglobin [Planctomycetota bacterium]
MDHAERDSSPDEGLPPDPAKRPLRLSPRGLVGRVGGRARVREILQMFYARLATDPMVGFHFAGHDLEAIVDGQLAFLWKAFGETAQFRGRHPSVAHRDLAPILRGQFDRRLVVLEEVLTQAGVPAPDREAWLAVERSMRAVVQDRGR